MLVLYGETSLMILEKQWRDNMKMWIVREQDGGLWLFCEEPIYDKFLQEWFTHKPCEFGCLPTECFPEVTFESSPMEVELKLTEK